MAAAGFFYDFSSGGLVSGPTPSSPATCAGADDWAAQRSNQVAIAEDNLDHSVSNYTLSEWMTQYALWGYLTLDTAAQDSSIVLPDFIATAAGSRFATLGLIENQLAAGCYGAAQSTLSSLGTLGSFSLPAPGTLYGSSGAVVADISDDDNIVDSISLIAHPNSPGIACGFMPDAIGLLPGDSVFGGLPQEYVKPCDTEQLAVRASPVLSNRLLLTQIC